MKPAPHQDEVATVGLIGFLVLLQLLGETRVELGLDDDASAVFGHALRVCGGCLAIGGVVLARGMPFDPEAAPAVKALRRAIVRAEPVLARIARAPIRPPA